MLYYVLNKNISTIYIMNSSEYSAYDMMLKNRIIQILQEMNMARGGMCSHCSTCPAGDGYFMPGNLLGSGTRKQWNDCRKKHGARASMAYDRQTGECLDIVPEGPQRQKRVSEWQKCFKYGTKKGIEEAKRHYDAETKTCNAPEDVQQIVQNVVEEIAEQVIPEVLEQCEQGEIQRVAEETSQDIAQEILPEIPVVDIEEKVEQVVKSMTKKQPRRRSKKVVGEGLRKKKANKRKPSIWNGFQSKFGKDASYYYKEYNKCLKRGMTSQKAKKQVESMAKKGGYVYY